MSKVIEINDSQLLRIVIKNPDGDNLVITRDTNKGYYVRSTSGELNIKPIGTNIILIKVV